MILSTEPGVRLGHKKIIKAHRDLDNDEQVSLICFIIYCKS